MRLILAILSYLFILPLYAQINNDNCDGAIEVFRGDNIDVDFGDIRNDYVPSNSCDYSSSDENVWFKITGTGDAIRLKLCGDQRNSIKIFEGISCYGLSCTNYVSRVGLFDEECTGGYAQTATFEGELDKTYYILCTTRYAYRTATLHVEMIEPIENNTCETAFPIDIDRAITYNNAGAFRSGFISCDATAGSGKDAWYSFKGTGDLVKITSNDWSNFYKRVYKGSCSQFKCVPEIWINEESGYETELGKTYYVQVFSTALEDNTFGVYPVNLVENDDCEHALPLMTGDTVLATFVDTREKEDVCDPSNRTGGYDIWYQFEGNDSVLHIYPSGIGIKHRILSGDCNNLECESLTQFIPTSSYSVRTEIGKNYYVNLFKTRGEDTVSLYTSVSAPVENDTYHDALPINCTDTIVGSLLNAQHDSEINDRTLPSVWYEFKGEGGFYKASAAFTDDESEYRPIIYFFKKENGKLVRAGDFLNGHIYFEQDRTYYINVVSGTRSNPFWLKLDCFPAIPNDLCPNAKMILPRDTIEGSFPYAQVTDNIACNNNNNGDIWYKIDGDGGYYNIGFTQESYVYGFYIYEGDCQNLTCLYDSNYDDFLNDVHLEQDKKYYIKVYSDRSYWNAASNYKLFFEQLQVAENDVCDRATLLECGSALTDSLDFARANDRTCSSTISYKGIWYRLEGTGNYYSINWDVHRGRPGYYTTGRQTFTLFEGECDELNCIDEQSNYQEDNLIFFAESGKTYYLVYHYVNSYYVDIAVDCIDYLDNDLYTNAYPIECNVQYTGYSHDNTYEFIDKCSTNSVRDDIWFSMVGGGEYITCSSSNIKGIYTLDDSGLSCYSSALYYRVFLEIGQTYYFRCVPFDLEEDYIKTYDFEITCGLPLENYNCSAAIELACGDSLEINTIYSEKDSEIPNCDSHDYHANKPAVWYRIIGDNSWKELYITNGDDRLYEGVCGEFICLGQDRRFYAKAGVDYYLRVYSYSSSYGVVSISMKCIEPPSNDLCEQAQTIQCGDTIRANFNYINVCDEEKDCLEQPRRRKVWYNITGGDEFVQLKLIPAINGSVNRERELQVYKEDCCYQDRLEEVYGSKNDLYFYAEKDTTYLIGLSYSDSDYHRTDYELVVNCLSEEERNFNTCSEAYQLSANQTYEADLVNDIRYNNYYYSDNNKAVHWVQFEGTGGLDTIEVDYQNGDISSVGADYYMDKDQNCSLVELKNSYELRPSSVHEKDFFIVSTIKDVKYVVGISSVQDSDTNAVVKITLKPSQQAAPCEILLPETIESEYGYSIRIPLEVAGAEGTFDVYVLDHDDKSSITHFKGIDVGKTFNLIPSSSGTSIVEYSSSECYGHAFLNLEISNVPPVNDPCADEINTCTSFIQHTDEELIDSTYQALKIESNAIIAYEAKVNYLAEEEILLLPGFETEDKSDFTANIEACEVEENSKNESIENRSEIIAKSVSHDIKLIVAPNPFMNQTNLQYQIQEQTTVSLFLLNLQGKLIRTIVTKQKLDAGTYNYNMTSTALQAGLYYLVLQTNGRRVVQKVVIMK